MSQLTKSDAEPSTRDNRPKRQGNSRKPASQEKLNISSGQLLIVDQFMLANQQFTKRLSEIDFNQIENDSKELTLAVSMYGGALVDCPKGTFRVFRDPKLSLLAIYPDEWGAEQPSEEDGRMQPPFDTQPVIENSDGAKNLGRVFVDTRCIAFLDASMLGNKKVMEEFQTLRSEENEKGARDLLRKNGAAVRYGFQKYGDELSVAQFEDPEIIALWPDITE